MDYSVGISLAYYLVFTLYSLWAIRVIRMNSQFILNRLLTIIMSLLSVWAFGFAIANSASDYGQALSWRQFSSLGWGVVYTLILHFVIVLIQQEDSDRLRIAMSPFKWFLLYLPSAVNLALFWWIPGVADRQYSLVETPYGWSHLWIDSPEYVYFYGYVLVYILLIIVLIHLWGTRINPDINQKTALILKWAFVVSFVAGIIMDLLSKEIFGVQIVQMSVVLGILPAGVMYEAVIRNAFVPERNKAVYDEDDVLLTSEVKLRIHTYIGALFLLSIYVSFAYHFFVQGEAVTEIAPHVFGLVLMLVLLKLLPLFKLESAKTDLITIGLLSVYTPYILIKYVATDAAMTIWVLPIFSIMLGVLFANRRAIWFSIVSSLIMILAIWVVAPEQHVRIYGVEHMLRIIILVVFSWFALFIRRVYRSKLSENEQRIEYQEMLAVVSSAVLAVNIDNTRDVVQKVFEVFGEFAGFDHLFVLRNDSPGRKLVYEQHWLSEEVKKNLEVEAQFEIQKANWLTRQENAGDELVIYKGEEPWPEEAEAEQRLMDTLGSKSALLYPICMNGDLVGYIGMSHSQSKKRISAEERHKYQTIVNILSDAYQKVRSEREIKEMAYYDGLTKLPNRASLTNRLKGWIDERPDQTFAVLFIDLDGFKFVNDSIGHAGGDRLLQMVAQRLKKCVKKDDLVFRFSGDEFVICHTIHRNSAEIYELVEKILERFREKFSIENNAYKITTSIGVAVYPIDGKRVGDLIKNADFAMYQAKLGGKNQFRVCTEMSKDSVHHRNRMILALHSAIEKDEFRVYFQPQVDGRSGEIIGYEALLRWYSSEFGFVSPRVFIPLAEQSGLIIAIGKWVIDRVCRQYQGWQGHKAGKVPVAINLSSQQFVEVGLVDFIKDTLKKYQLAPELVEFEVTESLAANVNSDFVRKLTQLKDSGFSIAMDDFGTEYSSLGRLKQLPVDRVKIDMSFVHGIKRDPKDEAVLDVIIYLADTFGLRVIAEGVENREQLDWLLDNRCHEIQGYYFHRPMEAKEIEKLYEV